MSSRELKPFQERGVVKSINVLKGCGLLWVPMGQGKSPISAKIAMGLDARRIVIACRDSGVKVWTKRSTDPAFPTGLDWLEHWYAPRKVIVHNMDKYQPGEREYWWNQATSKEEIHVWVVVYNTLGRDMGQNNKEQKRKSKKKAKPIVVPPKLIHARTSFDLIICDECKRISNTDSAGYQGIEKLRYDHPRPDKSLAYIIMLSGTPGDRGPQSFFGYWRLIDRKKFSSYWAYVNHFHVMMDNFWGGKEIGEQRFDTMPEWNRLLDRYAYVVQDKDIESDSPPLARVKIYAEMDPIQKELYEAILKDSLHVKGDSVVVAQNAMVRFLRLRQILICPRILGSEYSVGGAIKQFCDMMEDASEQDRQTVIFTPFTKAFAPFTEYLAYRGHKDVFHLQGGISPNQQDDRIEAWRRTHGIMLNSIQYAEAYSLEPARWGYFIGSEPSPDPNAQAEKRLKRFTTNYPVSIGYFTYGTKIDERMVDIVNIKQEHIDWSLPQTINALFGGTL